MRLKIAVLIFSLFASVQAGAQQVSAEARAMKLANDPVFQCMMYVLDLSENDPIMAERLDKTLSEPDLTACESVENDEQKLSCESKAFADDVRRSLRTIGRPDLLSEGQICSKMP